MSLPKWSLFQQINIFVVFLVLRDFLSRCTIRFVGNKRKIIKIIARCVGCSVFALTCYLCQPYGFVVLLWGLICLLIVSLRSP
jgi:hypothetical protein